MARNKRRKSKFSGPTPPERDRRKFGHIDGGKTVLRYDPGRDPRPRNLVNDSHRHQQRGT